MLNRLLRIAALAFVAPLGVLAETVKVPPAVYAVDADRALVRKGPGVGHPIVGTIVRGVKYVVHAKNGAGTWRAVWWKGNTAWIRATRLARSSGTGVVVAVPDLNVRSGPGTSYDRLGQVHSPQIYVRIDRAVGWHKINWGGRTAWVSAEYTRLAALGTTSTSREVPIITFNWPSRYHRTVSEVNAMFDRLAAQATVIGLQEAGWLQSILDNRKTWSIWRPNPSGDGDPDAVGQMLMWKNSEWSMVSRGTHLLNKPTRIQSRAAGPTVHSAKHVVWARLRHRGTGVVWTFAVCHFVPSKHLGGDALRLWKQQRDNLLAWWSRQDVRTVVVGDFNAEPKDDVAAPFWRVARVQTAPSHGTRRIDWIVRKPFLRAVGDGKALSPAGLSDHRPVRGIVRG